MEEGDVEGFEVGTADLGCVSVCCAGWCAEGEAIRAVVDGGGGEHNTRREREEEGLDVCHCCGEGYSIRGDV